MSHNEHKPAIFLAFANEQAGSTLYLRNLREEARRLRKVLHRKEAPYELILDQDVTADEFIGTVNKHNKRLAILHFGGHAGSYGLMLESINGQSTIGYADGLTKLLAQQKELKLVFLNGCSTEAQAQALRQAGVPIVIATSEKIDDETAMQFADHFYQNLIGDATIKEAFDHAEAAIQFKYGGKTRDLLATAGGPGGGPIGEPATADDPPWQIYCTDEAIVQWRFADVCKDPCFGLPELVPQDLPPRPFLSLARFQRKHAEIFFGRCREIRDLCDLVTDADGAPLILLYGQSGVGKSSLLDAGLMPRLEEDYHCSYVRRDQQAGLTGSLAGELRTSAEPRLIRQAWIDLEAQVQKPVVIILDQVEEMYTRPRLNPPQQCDEQTEFLNTLSELFADRRRRPQGKLILSFRKENLAEIEQRLSEKELPSVKIFIEHLNKPGIVEAITGVSNTPRLAAHYGLAVEQGLAATIADNLVEDPSSPIAPTLQMLLTKMWEQAYAQNPATPRFDGQLYRDLKRKGILLDDFLEQQLQLLKAQNQTLVDNGLALDLLFCHTTPAGTAEQHTIDELTALYSNHSRATVELLLQQCKDFYLLVDPGQHLQAAPSTSLAHDSLAPLVRARFYHSVAPGQRARRILENHMTEVLNNKQKALLKESDLKTVRRGKEGMRAWSPEEETQVARSAREATKQKWIFRSSLAALAAITVAFLLYAAAKTIQDQNLLDAQARTESQNLANLSLQRLTTDPVKSLDVALSALPDPATPRPYVPEAEFALAQALYGGLERDYVAAGAPPLSNGMIAPGKTWIAVGSDAARLVKLDLTQAITLTGQTGRLKGVAWATDGETLLGYNENSLYVWPNHDYVIAHTFDEPITCARWRPNSEQIAVCSGRSVQIWSYPQNRLERVGADGDNALSFASNAGDAFWSPDGHWLAAWNDTENQIDQTFVIWDADNGRLLARTPISYAERIAKSSWSTDNVHVVAAAVTKPTVYIWSVDQPGAPAQISLDGRVDGIEFVDAQHFVTWGKSDVTRLWLMDGARIKEFGMADDGVQGIALSPGRDELLTFLGNGSAYLWSLADGARLGAFCCHDKRMSGASWRKSGDTQYLVTSSIDGSVKVWDLTAETAVVTLRGHESWGGRADVLDMRWQDDQRLLTYGRDGSLRLWQVFDEQGSPLCSGVGRQSLPICYGFSQALPQFNSELTFVHWLDDQTFVAVDKQNTAYRCSLAACEARTVTRNSAAPGDIIWSPDGQAVFTYTAGLDGHVVDFATGSPIATVALPVTTAYWLEIGLLLSAGEGSAFLVEPQSGAVFDEMGGYASPIVAAELKAGRLAAAEANGTIHIWDVAKHQEVATLKRNLPASLSSIMSPINKLVWSQDGSRLLAGGVQLTLWDVDRNKVIWPADEESSNAQTDLNPHADLSPDGALVAYSQGSDFYVKDTQGSTLWHNQEHTEPVLGVQWIMGLRWPNQERSHWIVGCAGRWLLGQPCSPSPQRLLLLTWSGDGTIRIWDWQDQKEIMRLADTGPMMQAAVSPTGGHILSAALTPTGLMGTVRIWQTWLQNPEAMLQTACSQITRAPDDTHARLCSNRTAAAS